MNVLSNTGSKILGCLLPGPQNWYLLTNLPCVHHLLFLSAWARPWNLVNTLSIMFPEPLSLGYDTAHCLVCWCEDSLLARACRQWPPRGDLLPHLDRCPCSLSCPSTLPHVSGQEAALTYCVSHRTLYVPSHSPGLHLTFLQPLSHMGCKNAHLCSWNMQTPLAPSLKHWKFLVCLEKKKEKKQLQSLIALTRICNFPKGRPRPPALLTLGQLSLYYACPQIISDHLWFTMASQVGIAASLNWLWCSWRDESNLSSGCQLTIKAAAVLGLMLVHLTVPKQSWRLQWLVPKRPSKTPCTSVYISLV